MPSANQSGFEQKNRSGDPAQSQQSWLLNCDQCHLQGMKMLIASTPTQVAPILCYHNESILLKSWNLNCEHFFDS